VGVDQSRGGPAPERWGRGQGGSRGWERCGATEVTPGPSAAARPLDEIEQVFDSESMNEEADQARQLWVTASEVEAQGLLGSLTLFGGIPYRVTAIQPIAQLRWAILGVAEPDHPQPGDWKGPRFS